MQIGNKLFPYPVLNRTKNLSAYKTSEFSFDYEEEQDDENYILHNVCYTLTNDELNELIESGRAEARLLVECSETIFRENYPLTAEPTDIKIPYGSLRGRVVISCFVFAKETIEHFSSDDFLEDYYGYSFDIEPYSIMAVDDGFTTVIDYDETTDDKVSSIFLVISNEDTEVVKYRSQGTKIIIDVPSDAFISYDTLKMNEYTRNIYFGLLAIPALQHMLQRVQMDMMVNNTTLHDETIEYTWIESVRAAYKKKFEEELDDQIFLSEDTESLAQKLMNYGSSKALGDVFDIVTRQEMGVLTDE